MQLLIQTQSPDFTAWKAAYDAQAEALDDAGLNQLQIWTTRDGARLFLFTVNDPAAAGEWLKAQQSLGHITSAEFLRTA